MASKIHESCPLCGDPGPHYLLPGRNRADCSECHILFDPDTGDLYPDEGP